MKRGLSNGAKKASQNQRSWLGHTFASETRFSFLNRFKSRLQRRSATLALLIAVLFISACASIQRPTGGPKDLEPPKLLSALPKNLTTNFTAKKIILTFDEYIRLQNEFREITYAPDIENIPEIKNLGKSIEITFKDSLLANTTYTINFGEAIQDVNEGNKLNNFTYVFSTGDELDSLSISGKVINAFTYLPEKEILVFALPEKDAANFGVKKPAIFTKTDTGGNYSLNNLKEDNYRVYALGDKNLDRIYQQGTEYIGLHPKSILLNENKSDVNISIFNELPQQFRVVDRKIESDGSILLSFNRPLVKPEISVVDPPSLNEDKIISFSKSLDTAKIWVKNHQFDSLKIAINEADTLLQSISLSKGRNETYNSVLQPRFNLENETTLNPFRQLELKFNTPLLSVDQSEITLREDTLMRTGFKAYVDPNNPQILKIEYPWKEFNYELDIAEGAIKAMYGFSNRRIFKKIEKFNLKNYGRLDISYKLPDSTNQRYIAEIMNDKAEVVQSNILTNDTSISYQNFRTGKYFIRIITDSNNNGRWDTGNLNQDKLPERIWIDPRPFTIRTNWEVKETIQIPTD